MHISQQADAAAGGSALARDRLAGESPASRHLQKVAAMKTVNFVFMV
jgi:hypothetical protein